jgi:hypothetical protein
MREFCTSGSVGTSGRKRPGVTRHTTLRFASHTREEASELLLGLAIDAGNQQRAGKHSLLSCRDLCRSARLWKRDNEDPQPGKKRFHHINGLPQGRDPSPKKVHFFRAAVQRIALIEKGRSQNVLRSWTLLSDPPVSGQQFENSRSLLFRLDVRGVRRKPVNTRDDGREMPRNRSQTRPHRSRGGFETGSLSPPSTSSWHAHQAHKSSLIATTRHTSMASRRAPLRWARKATWPILRCVLVALQWLCSQIKRI